MKAIIVTDVELNALLDRLELKKLQSNNETRKAKT